MKRIISLIVTALLLISLLVLAPSESVFAAINPIPLDKDKMDDPNPAFYLSDNEYRDDSLHITIERGVFEDCNYVVAYIQIADPSQIRTRVGSPDGKSRLNLNWWLSHLNPILAINGDNYGDNLNGYGRHIVRQGVLKRHDISGRQKVLLDALIIDDKGDFHIIRNATETDFDAFEGTIVNSFSFGPALIVDGELVTEFDAEYGKSYAAYKAARRMCIAQTGPLSYMIVTTEGPEDPGNKESLFIDRFAYLVSTLGTVSNAYNLDGGSSAYLVFGKKKINSVNAKTNNRLTDMIYFASAYQPDNEPVQDK